MFIKVVPGFINLMNQTYAGYVQLYNGWKKKVELSHNVCLMCVWTGSPYLLDHVYGTEYWATGQK